MPTNPPCARCGQGDCPTVLWRKQYGVEPDFNEGWVAAFHACAAMKRSVDAERDYEARAIIRDHDKHCSASTECWLCRRDR